MLRAYRQNRRKLVASDPFRFTRGRETGSRKCGGKIRRLCLRRHGQIFPSWKAVETGPGPPRYRILTFYFLFPSVGGTTVDTEGRRRAELCHGGREKEDAIRWDATEWHGRASLRKIFFGFFSLNPPRRHEKFVARRRVCESVREGLANCGEANGKGGNTEGSLTRRCDFR